MVAAAAAFGKAGYGVNFQVTVLKILVSYPDGFAVMAGSQADMAILATSAVATSAAASGQTELVALPPASPISTFSRKDWSSA